jgi:hypothetical protein
MLLLGVVAMELCDTDLSRSALCWLRVSVRLQSFSFAHFGHLSFVMAKERWPVEFRVGHGEEDVSVRCRPIS